MEKELTTTPPASARLLKGAAVMAQAWRRGDRCPAGWSLSLECSCTKPTTFCKAREQWILIFLESGEALRRGGDSSPFGMLEAMTSEELGATGLTITGDTGLRVGPKGSMIAKSAADVTTGASGAAGSLMRLLEKFPGAKITAVAPAPQAAPA